MVEVGLTALRRVAGSPLGKLTLDVGALGAALVVGFVAGSAIEESAGLEVLPAWLEILSVAASVMTIAVLVTHGRAGRWRALVDGLSHWSLPAAAVTAVVLFAPLTDVRFGLGADTMARTARDLRVMSTRGRAPSIRRAGLFRVQSWSENGSCVRFVTDAATLFTGTSGVEYCAISSDHTVFPGWRAFDGQGAWHTWADEPVD